MQGHLDACVHCLEAFEFEYVLRKTIAAHCRETVPEELVARVREMIVQEAGTPGGSGTFSGA